MIKLIFLSALLLLCGGCSLNPAPLSAHLNEPERSLRRTCAELLVATEGAVATAGVIDAQDARIAGFPYLRVNRFLSSFRHQVAGEAFESWVDRLQDLALDGWRVELMNLPANEWQRLSDLAEAPDSSKPALLEALAQCGKVLRKYDLDEEEERGALKGKAVVAAEYRIGQQVAGLYPLTAIAFRLGILRWHEKTLVTYAIPPNELPVTGRLTRYAPERQNPRLSAAEVAGIIERSSRNPLAIPSPEPVDQARLFAQFAPVLEIDTASPDDRIGAPTLKSDQSSWIDTAQPVVYTQMSHTRIGHRNLLQLNYLFWFPSRPKQSVWDLLGGHLDGLIWRITLSPDGRPWLFDSIHLCGCYHLFFPTDDTRVSKRSAIWSEPDFMPQPALNLRENERTVLRIAATSHYIDRVYTASQVPNDAIPYRWRDADDLRSLTRPEGGRRSLFGPDGIVAGSDRNERFFFWPMGIPHPGAMRQWGHHATAFVGRRHFDDPRLFERSFGLEPRAPTN